jgi:hypothetical protein
MVEIGQGQKGRRLGLVFMQPALVPLADEKFAMNSKGPQ